MFFMFKESFTDKESYCTGGENLKKKKQPILYLPVEQFRPSWALLFMVYIMTAFFYINSSI